MRIEVDIDDALLAEAMEATGLRNGESVVEAAMRFFTTHHIRRKALHELRGMGWDGNLDEMRRDMGTGEDRQDAAE